MSSPVPDGWEYDFLSKFVVINPSLDKALELTDDKNVSFIKMEDVSNNAVVTNLRVKKYSEVKKGFTKFQDNDVLVAKITPCFENGKGGHVKNLVNGVGFGSTEFHVFRAKEDFNSAYFHQFANFPNFRLQAEASMCGTGGQRRVQTDFFRTYKTSFPPLPEQQKIAQILTSVDEVIEKTQAQIDKLKDLKTAMMQELLTNGIGHLEFKDSPVGKIPVGWDVKQLSETFDLSSGSTPSRREPHYFSPAQDAIPWIKTLDMHDGLITTTDEKITKLAIENSSCKLLPIGTAIVAMYGGWNQIGRSGVLAIEATTNQAICALKPIGLISGEFVNYWLISKRNIWKSVAASSRKDPNITKQDVSEFLVVVPSIKEQRDIVARLDSLTCQVDNKKKLLVRYQAIKKALMQDLLTGKVRVKVS